jgi:hypothetical protein
VLFANEQQEIAIGFDPVRALRKYSIAYSEIEGYLYFHLGSLRRGAVCHGKGDSDDENGQCDDALHDLLLLLVVTRHSFGF